MGSSDVIKKLQEEFSKKSIEKSAINLKKKILIVDDESFNRMALKSILEIIGVSNQVCEAGNGLLAFEMVKEDVQANFYNHTNFELILMDFQMPVMDGNQASTKIREFLYSHDTKQPIICGVTGHVEQSYIERMIKSGMNQVFSKPISKDLLKLILIKLNYL